MFCYWWSFLYPVGTVEKLNCLKFHLTLRQIGRHYCAVDGTDLARQSSELNSLLYVSLRMKLRDNDVNDVCESACVDSRHESHYVLVS